MSATACCTDCGVRLPIAEFEYVEALGGYFCAECRDPEPQPTDGPEYHADHAAWRVRNARSGVGA